METPGADLPERRVTDAERDAVIARLRAATVEGSLDLDELGDRIALIYQARTTGELVAVTRDLPAPRLRGAAPARPARGERRSILRNAAFRIHATAYGLTNGFLVGTWAITSSGDTIFWPFFPAAGWGVALGLHGLAAATYEERRHAKRVARAERSLREAPAAPARLAATPLRTLGAATQRVAVLFTDVVGSTQLTAALGDDGWHQVRSRYHDLVSASLATHGGQRSNVAGDGVLARFDDAVAAVRCAIDIQRSLQHQREGRGFPVRVRVGVHAGEAVDDAGDLVGGVINLAARVTSEADPDEVLVTEAVAERLGDRFALDDRGLRHLKGIAGPRHLLAVRWT